MLCTHEGVVSPGRGLGEGPRETSTRGWAVTVSGFFLQGTAKLWVGHRCGPKAPRSTSISLVPSVCVSGSALGPGGPTPALRNLMVKREVLDDKEHVARSDDCHQGERV